MSEIKVMMFGASRSGKTSILSSMLEGCADNLYKYGLQLRAENEDSSFRDAIHDMMDLCEVTNSVPRMTTLMGTREIKEYRFRLSYLNAPKAGNNTLVIYDVPGEMFDKMSTEDTDRLVNIIQECQILIIAVDTPALLWTGSVGQAYQSLISCKDALRTLIPNLGAAVDANRSEGDKCIKSIIFIPIKCEYQLHRDANQFRNDIKAAISYVYGNVLDMTEKGRYKISIIPMETIGGVQFHKYSDNESMKVLAYNPESSDTSFKMGKEYEDEGALELRDGKIIMGAKFTRCETLDDKTVIIARTGRGYRLKEGDVLMPVNEIQSYPYVYSPGRAIPYIWYKPTGTGFCQKNCEKLLYEVLKIAIQQVASSSFKDINALINWEIGFFEGIILRLLGMFDNTKQLQELCKALKDMSLNHEFDEAIVLRNNIDNSYDTGLKIRVE